MYKNNRYKAPSEYPQVVLARGATQLLSDQDFNQLEPQTIGIRPSNTSTSSIVVDKDPAVSDRVRGILQSGTLFATRVLKLSVKRMFINTITPNVNERNNTVTFFSTNSGVEHTVTIIEGFYNTVTALMDALVAALNTATGASGIVFSHLVPATNPIISVLTAVGGSYHFNVASTTITRGEFLYNLPTSQADTLTKTVGAISGLYTRWVDLVSQSLTQYTKNPNTSNVQGNNGLVHRLFVDPDANAEDFIQEIVENLVWWSWNTGNTISNFDFELLDEFSELYFVPQYAEGTKSGFYWSVQFQTETYS